MPLLIRPARPSDIARIQPIYAHAVTHGTASWEWEAPDEAEMTRRMAALLEGGFPYSVVEEDGAIRGYAYAGPYRPRAAYRWTCEDSIYIAPDAQGRGLGRLLLADLIAVTTSQGFRQMVAIIGDSNSAPSIGLHTAMGFQPAGIIRSCGYKHGRWLDQVLMQRALGPGDATPPA
jgi:phosphinothricin acetyltransferase